MKHEGEPAAVYAEYQLSCSEAMVAGTLALMTAYAQAAADGQRGPLAQKIVANLAQLAGHSCLSPQFRMMLGNLCAHWQLLRPRDGDMPPTAGADAWHPAPGRLQ